MVHKNVEQITADFSHFSLFSNNYYHYNPYIYGEDVKC